MNLGEIGLDIFSVLMKFILNLDFANYDFSDYRFIHTSLVSGSHMQVPLLNCCIGMHHGIQYI